MSNVTTSPDATRVVRVVGWGEADFDAAQQGVARLAASGVPRVLAPTRVALRPDGAVVVEERAPHGETLAAVLAARGPLRAGECVWWATAVAEALAALHREGITHGAIDADAVWMGPDEVVLGGVAVVQLAREPGTAAADVCALGALLAASVREDDAARVRAWAEPMTDSRPEARPTAAMAARALGSCAPAEPIRPYPAGIAAALRRAAGAGEHGADGHDAGGRQGWFAHPEGPAETELLPEARWWRLARRARSVMRLRSVRIGAAVTACVALAWGLGGLLIDTAEAGSPVRIQAFAAHGNPLGDRPAFAAAALSDARIAALAAGDGAALIDLTAPGGDARIEAEATAALLDAGAVRLEGLAATVVAAHVNEAPSRPPRQGDEASVTVELEIGAYDAIADGRTTRVDAIHHVSELVLVYDEAAGWLVAAAR